MAFVRVVGRVPLGTLVAPARGHIQALGAGGGTARARRAPIALEVLAAL